MVLCLRQGRSPLACEVFYLLVNLVMFCRAAGAGAVDASVPPRLLFDSRPIQPSFSGLVGRVITLAAHSVVVLLVRASAFENNVAGEAVLDGEAELRLVEDVFLGPEVDLDGLGEVLAFKFVLGYWGHDESLRHLAQWL